MLDVLEGTLIGECLDIDDGDLDLLSLLGGEEWGLVVDLDLEDLELSDEVLECDLEVALDMGDLDLCLDLFSPSDVVDVNIAAGSRVEKIGRACLSG